jgi:TFIIH basal transcription factor complex TTD-A subunit
VQSEVCPPLPSTISKIPIKAAGVLVECDPSIKSIIIKIDSERNDFVVEELDDQTLVIKEGKLVELKARLDDVSPVAFSSQCRIFPMVGFAEPVMGLGGLRKMC